MLPSSNQMRKAQIDDKLLSRRSFHWAAKWRALFASNIADLDTLRRQCATKGIVAVDFEPWSKDQSLPSEVALSFLPPMPHDQHFVDKDGEAQNPAYTSLTALQEHGIQTYSIRVAGREPRKKKREPLRFGTCQTIAPESVEDELLVLMESFVSSTGLKESSSMMPTSLSEPPSTYESLATSSGLILTGFSLTYELNLLARSFPRILKYFSAWTDIQDQVKNISTWATPETVGSKLGNKPSQTRCFVALGFGDQEGAVSSRAHRAGNDTVRTLAMFLRLTSRSSSAPKLLLPETAGMVRAKRGKMKLPKTGVFGSRPHPEDEYPFIVKISHQGTMADRAAHHTLELFAKYNPTAVGVPKNAKKENAKWAWLCLPTCQDAKRFVEEVNGQVDESGGVWEAVYDVSPEIEKRTEKEWEEIRALRQAEKDAAADLVRSERRSRAVPDELLGSDLFD